MFGASARLPIMLHAYFIAVSQDTFAGPPVSPCTVHRASVAELSARLVGGMRARSVRRHNVGAGR